MNGFEAESENEGGCGDANIVDLAETELMIEPPQPEEVKGDVL